MHEPCRPPSPQEAMAAQIGADDRPAIAPQFHLQYEPVHAGWVLLHPGGLVKLNLPAAEILMRCDGRRSVDDIMTELEEAFSSPALREDVQAFLGTACDHGWIALP